MTPTQQHTTEIYGILREVFDIPPNIPVFFPDRRCNRILAGDILLHSMVRGPKFYSQRHQVTFRNRHYSEGSLIYQRILNGYAKYYFYGIKNPEDPTTLVFWRIVDLDILRAHANEILAEVRFNVDGYSGFKAISVDSLPEAFVVACSELESGSMSA